MENETNRPGKENWKEFFWKKIAAPFAVVVLSIAFYFLVKRYDGLRKLAVFFQKILTPFIYGGVIAFLLKTPCKTIEKLLNEKVKLKTRKMSCILSVLIVYILAIFIVYFLISMVVPQMVDSVVHISRSLPEYFNRFSNWIDKVFSGNAAIQSHINNLSEAIEEKLQTWFSTSLMPALESIMGDLALTMSSIAAFFYNLFIGLIISIYILLDREKFKAQGKTVIYAFFKVSTGKAILDELTFINDTFVGFFAGKILDSTIIGLICYAFCFIMSLITGFQDAILISVIVGVTNIIPYFGPYLGAIMSLPLIFIKSPVDALVFLIFIIILQQIDGNILGPKLLANSVGLSAFWVLFSITLFNGLMGFAGLLVGVPVFAVIYDAFKRLVSRGLKKHGKLPEVPASEKQKPSAAEK